MQISVLGQTDKRPVIYTLLKMLENVGEVAYITNDAKAKRLMSEGPGVEGTYRNITIFCTDAGYDDVWETLHHAPDDFEFVIYDNLYGEDVQLVIYVMGIGPEEADEMVLAAFEEGEYFTVKMGKALKAPKPTKEKSATEGPVPVRNSAKQEKKPTTSWTVPYDGKIMQAIETCEYYKELVPMTSTITTACAHMLSPIIRVPEKSLVAVMARTNLKGGANK